MKFWWGGQEGVQSPCCKELGPGGKKRAEVHLSLNLCLSLGLGGGVSPPKPGEPIPTLSCLPQKYPPPQPLPSFLLFLLGYMPGNGLLPGECSGDLSKEETGLTPRIGLVPAGAIFVSPAGLGGGVKPQKPGKRELPSSLSYTFSCLSF